MIDKVGLHTYTSLLVQVDIAIKLRSCKGSCASYQEFSVDKESYVALEKQLDRLDPLQVQNVETVTSLKVLKIKQLKELNTDRPSIYKAGTVGTEREAQKKTFFGDVGQLQLSLEAEGSTAETAATVSKVITGTGQSTPISTQTQTQTLSCTQTVRKITTHTKDGIQEKYETVRTGPGCDAIGKFGISEADLLSAAKEGKELSSDGFRVKVTTGDSKSITTLNRGEGELGGFAEDFFQGLGSRGQDSKFSSSFTSSSTSKSIITGGRKGFNSDTKSITSTSSPADFGDDFGAFLLGDIKDDLPDLHARSFKSSGQNKDESIAGAIPE